MTDLGFWDENNNTQLGPTGDGLGEAHIITIRKSAGAIIAQATVPLGTAGTLIDEFRYIALLS